jgi:hypothetical protein
MDRGKKYINEGRKRIQNNNMYGLSMTELANLIETAYDDELISAIAEAFYMGVEAGARMIERGC